MHLTPKALALLNYIANRPGDGLDGDAWQGEAMLSRLGMGGVLDTRPRAVGWAEERVRSPRCSPASGTL